MKIRTKFSLFASFLVFGVVVATLVSAFFIQRRLVLRQIEDKLKTQSRSFAAVCKQSMLLNNEVMLLNYIRTVKSLEGIAYAYFADLDGQILAHTDGELIYTPLAKWDSQKLRDVMEFKEELEIADRQGKLHHYAAATAYAKPYVQEEMDRAFGMFFKKSLLIAIVTAILGLLGAFALSTLMSRPIQELAHGAKEVGSGNLKYRVPIASRDELGILANEFNNMASALAQLDEMKDHFIQMVSHDLKSPLAGAKGYVQYLLDSEAGSLSAEQKDLLNTVDRNLDRLSNFITEILDLAKIDSGKMEYRIKPAPLLWVTNEVVKLFKFTAEKKKIKLKTELPEKLPLALMDQDRIFQVVTNVVSNAIKFTPEEGTVTIGVSSDDSYLEVTVSDNGPGIDSKLLPKLFGKFARGEVLNKKGERISGTGLGLAISKGIIEAHQGKIWVESEVGKGTTFHFTLPSANETDVDTHIANGMARKIDNPEFAHLVEGRRV